MLNNTRALYAVSKFTGAVSNSYTNNKWRCMNLYSTEPLQMAMTTRTTLKKNLCYLQQLSLILAITAHASISLIRPVLLDTGYCTNLLSALY